MNPRKPTLADLAAEIEAEELILEELEQDGRDHQEWLDLLRHYDWEEERVRY